ncbi:probable G-protein coupled receptor tkr-1 isoform X2 [Tetranychus urticae]|uniref:probable G-protein coupled receptor tkr-1 isoform X2 n=1 Tax=Tetranychus urticae TaxID=32264 RepID=UPI00077C0921|nr:probable G-protein coupled receptor tkr-1 isoform X2 [Tetranychus urticae]
MKNNQSKLPLYFAVVHPLRSRVHQSKSRTIKILHGVWYIPLVAAGPFLMPSKAYPNRLTSPLGTIERLTCFVNFSPAFRAKYYTCLFIFFYLIPLLFIGWTCFQIARCLIKQTILQREGLLRRQEVNRRKVAKMILVVVFAFTISWTPYFLVSIVTQYQEVNFMTKHNYFFTMLCINLFAFLNSSINPLIYVLMSTRFRLGFTNILRLMLCISSHEELEDSDRIVSGDQHHNHNNLHGQANNSQQSTNQSQQLTRKNENDDPSKVKSLTHMAKYRHRLVMFICGQVSHLSTDSGHSESSPPVSGCLPDKPTEKLDKTDPGKRSDGIKIESKAECLLINGSNLTSNVPQVNNCLPSITVSTHLQQPNVTSLGLSPNSVASSFIPHLIQSDCTEGSGETQGITLNDSRFSKRRYSDNFLFAIKFDNNPLNESETGNNDNKLINNPLDKEHSLASNKLSQICLNVDDSPNNNLNNDYQSGQINYNRSKSEPHFITSTQL